MSKPDYIRDDELNQSFYEYHAEEDRPEEEMDLVDTSLNSQRFVRFFIY